MTSIYAIKDADGNVMNRIVATADFVEAVHPGRYEWIEDVVPPVTAPTYPTLSRKQLRNGLLSIGVTSADVEAQIASIADPLEREAAMIDWQDTQSYQRDYPMINQIGAALGLPAEQIDALWLWSAGN
jgi:hypothetical protein